MPTPRDEPPAETTLPHFEVPAGACDCHWHLFDLSPKYQWQEKLLFERVSHPLAELRAIHSKLGIQRGVFVQAGMYADNELLIDSSRLTKTCAG